MLNTKSRTENVFKNIVGGIGGQIFTSILMFVCRTIFIKYLGATYLGVNGLFGNILSMLALSELGIGPAIVFSMYKPIATGDEIQIAKLMNFYKTAYRYVALIISVIGLALVPFIDFFIENTNGIENLRLIYVLILSGTVVSYFYAYKGSMLRADQKSYVTVIFKNIFAVVQNVVQIIILIITGNYILYLITNIITNFLSNVILSKYVDKKYSFLVKYKYEKLDSDEKKKIFKRVQGMMMHKIGGYVLNGTDNLVISKFVGVIAVGIYSNYLLIIKLIKTYVSQVVNAITASVGNVVAKETKEKSYDVFKTAFFVHFWIYGFCFVCFWCVFQPFIELWLGQDYLLNNATLMLVLVNFFCYGMQECINTFTNATGLFWETRYKPLVECVVNLGVSIILAAKIGITGVFIGTAASYWVTSWINPKIVYKYQFNKSVVSYFVKYIIYLVVTIGSGIGINIIWGIIFPQCTFISTAVRIVGTVILCNIIFLILFFKTSEFKYCCSMAKKMILKK